MSEFDLSNRNTGASQKPGSLRKAGSSEGLTDKVAEAGSALKRRAGDALRDSTDMAQDKFNEAASAAKDVAAEAADRLQEQAREQQHSGADFVGRLAGNIRNAAHAFEQDAPLAARGINSAADYVDEAADKIRNGSIRDLLDGATDFAKRQPAAFLGLSVLAGFAAVRFLKASGNQSSTPSSTHRGEAS
jgi:hypothetical protein